MILMIKNIQKNSWFLDKSELDFFMRFPEVIIGWEVCILGWVSDKYFYLLKPCCNYIFQISILSISTKVMGGNDNLWTFFKDVHFLPVPSLI